MSRAVRRESLVVPDVWSPAVATPVMSLAVPPSARRLTSSLRDIGYDFPSAVADLVDNSVTAGATRVDISVLFNGAASRVVIADDGVGMGRDALVEALRFGSRRSYSSGDLGRYGLGLKTASLSQCRSVTVATSRAPVRAQPVARQLDLDIICDYDEWLIVDPGRTDAVRRAGELLDGRPGTVVIWEGLDRVLPDKRPDGGWARRRLETLAARTAAHLSMVFHRFLEGATAKGGPALAIVVNGAPLRAWNPFAPEQAATRALPVKSFEVVVGQTAGTVGLARFVLPSREAFTSAAEFERMSGPLKWNRQQGLYVYRADRLVQWGGWGGVRGIDEHTKMARAALDFDTDLDEAFTINVAKMRVHLPAALRQLIEQPLHEVCAEADAAYRGSPRRPRAAPVATAGHAEVGRALRSAAFQAGEHQALRRILAALAEHDADLERSLRP